MSRRNPWEHGQTKDPQVKRDREIRDALRPVLRELDADPAELVRVLERMEEA